MTHTSSHGCLLHFARRLKSPRLTNRVMGAFSIRREGPHLNPLRWILVMPMTHNSSHGRFLHLLRRSSRKSVEVEWCGSDHGRPQHIECLQGGGLQVSDHTSDTPSRDETTSCSRACLECMQIHMYVCIRYCSGVHPLCWGNIYVMYVM